MPSGTATGGASEPNVEARNRTGNLSRTWQPNAMVRVAFDVDLHRVHGYSERDGRVCYNAPDWPWDVLHTHDTILVEIASPVDTSKVKAQAYNRRKWAISNSLQIGRLQLYLQQQGLYDRLLVSPSTDWTLGHPEKLREAAAGVIGQDNHDIRACRCMLFYHSTNPDKWRPLDEYLAGLSKKRKTKRRK